jgi:hypothetical protein
MWAHAIVTALGIWLMVAPSVLEYGDPARINDWIVGPIVATFGCIALWEATRGCRWVNFILGIWLVIAPWPLWYGTLPAMHSTAIGLLIVGLSLVKGRRVNEIGGGWSMLWRRDTAQL